MSQQSSVTTILMLSANPNGSSLRRLDQEKRDIAAGLERSRHRDSFRLETKNAVRPRDLQRAMLDLNPQIVHFSGQGEAEAGLVFEDEIGQAKLIDAEALAGLFKLFAGKLQCVVLNACYSESQAEAIVQHIPYVIGMSQAIDERAAIEFAVGFYDALGAGREIEFAYQFGCSAARLNGTADLTPVLKKQPNAAPQRTVTIAPLTLQPFNPAIYSAATWVERSDLTEPLLQILQGNCRVLALTGITGIGKTALAERLISELRDDRRFCQLNLDEGGVMAEFSSSGAVLLRSLGEEPTLEDQKDPQNLLVHLLQLLQSHPYRVQVDSMEKLLEGDDRQGWSEFCDRLWLDLLQQLLAGQDCQSQLILTTQDLPGELESIGSRCPQFWYCQPIRGLSQEEQLQLFQKRGIVAASNATVEAQHLDVTTYNASAEGQPGNVTTDNANAEDHNANAEGQHPIAEGHNASAEGRHPIAETHNAVAANSVVSLLKRIGRLSDGHPLILRVIAEDIKACGGNVQRYWQQGKFAELEANRPANLSRSKLQLQVKKPVKDALARLPEDALQLLCRSAVYRRPVPGTFWLAMLPDCAHPETALELLKARALAQEEWEEGAWLGTDGELPLRQHNLIRSVAYELLKADTAVWQTAERTAAEQWLNHYEAVPEAPNLEQVRGNLEAFHHVYEVEDWEQAKEILLSPLRSFSKVHLPRQLEFWSYYQEGIQLCQKFLNKSEFDADTICLRMLGNYYLHLANCSEATNFYQQSLTIARETGDREGEGTALGSLGNTYRRLGNYAQAIESHQQHLTIAREIGDRRGEGIALGSLGSVYYTLDNYAQAIEFHHQALVIMRDTDDQRSEGAILGNIGLAYASLGDYAQAIESYQQHLSIAREIGDRQGEGNALGSLGNTYRRLGNYAQAIESHQQRLAIAREIGDRQGEGNALGSLGNAYASLGNYPQAIEFYQHHLAIAREIGDRQGEGIALVNWGHALSKLEQYSESLEHLPVSLEIFREIGNRANESEALLRLYLARV